MTVEINVIYDNDVYIDPIITAVSWSGDITQPYRTLEVNVRNTTDGRTKALPLIVGKELRLLADGAELFRGVIFATSNNAKAEMTLTAYDENVYLTKSMDTAKFSTMTASSVIRQICGKFGIPTGVIADTGYVIPKLILRDMSLWDMCTTALTETRKQKGRRFLLRADSGKLTLIERGAKVVTWVLDDRTNILDASYSQSIEELRNQIRVIGGDPEKNPLDFTVSDAVSAAKFGKMQHLENADPDINRAQVEQMARKLLAQLNTINDEASVTALGNTEVTSGAAIYVKESLSGIIGGFYVITDSHSWEGGSYKMALTISGDEGLPKLEYVAPEEPTAKKKKSEGDIYDRIIASNGVGDWGE